LTAYAAPKLGLSHSVPCCRFYRGQHSARAPDYEFRSAALRIRCAMRIL